MGLRVRSHPQDISCLCKHFKIPKCQNLKHFWSELNLYNKTLIIFEHIVSSWLRLSTPLSIKNSSHSDVLGEIIAKSLTSIAIWYFLKNELHNNLVTLLHWESFLQYHQALCPLHFAKCVNEKRSGPSLFYD